MKHTLRTAAAVGIYRMLPRDSDGAGADTGTGAGWLYSVAAGRIPRTGAVAADADASGLLAAVRRWMAGTWTSQNMDLLGAFYIEAAHESMVAGTTGSIMLVVRPAAVAGTLCPQFIFLTPEAAAPAPGPSAVQCCFRFCVRFEWTIGDGTSSAPPPPVTGA